MTLSATCAIGEVSHSPSHYRGEQYDSDLGLYYLRARYYNPATGRFLSRDPEDRGLIDPVYLHKYLYANGDPVNSLDPTGREAMFETGKILDGIERRNTKVILGLGCGIELLWAADAELLNYRGLPGFLYQRDG